MKRLSLILFVFSLTVCCYSQEKSNILMTLQQKGQMLDAFYGCVYVLVDTDADSTAMKKVIPSIKKTVLANSEKGSKRLEIHFVNSVGRKVAIYIMDLSDEKVNYQKFVEYRGAGTSKAPYLTYVKNLIKSGNITLPKDILGMWYSGATLKIYYKEGSRLKVVAYWSDGTRPANKMPDIKVFEKNGTTVYRTYFLSDGMGPDSTDHVINRFGDLEQHHFYPNFKYLDTKFDMDEFKSND